MQYISSDTNVWIDFLAIDRINLPFRLPFTYIMFEETIKNELIKPANLGTKLIECGLESVDITLAELIRAERYSEENRKLSPHDCVALAIAKERDIILLTGDGVLRNVAKEEGVTVIGTLGILDQLLKNELIDVSEYKECLQGFESLNGGAVRLPRSAISERLERTK